MSGIIQTLSNARIRTKYAASKESYFLGTVWNARPIARRSIGGIGYVWQGVVLFNDKFMTVHGYSNTGLAESVPTLWVIWGKAANLTEVIIPYNWFLPLT